MERVSASGAEGRGSSPLGGTTTWRERHGRSPRRFPLRRVARLLGWNALVLFALLLLAGGGAEAWLRLTVPFRDSVAPRRLAPGVGFMLPPHREVRATDGLEFWTVSRTNGLGFLDREPPDPERAAESCHVTLIGDSFVEAPHVPISAKLQVRLEEMAAREAPALDVTTSAFGYQGTGQISQLAFYDAFARGLSPDVVVLVAVDNDFYDNSLPLQVYFHGYHPDYPGHLSARRGADGEMEFVPPADARDYRANQLPALPRLEAASARNRVEWQLREWSYLADWLFLEFDRSPWLVPPWEGRLRALNQRAALISQHPRHGTFALGWNEEERSGAMYAPLLEESPPPVFREALDVTRFALEQFRERTERDGAALVILATHLLGGAGDPMFELWRDLAGDIPVVSLTDYVDAAGGEIEDLHWEHDQHWNATGHRRAAEALQEWLRENPEACD